MDWPDPVTSLHSQILDLPPSCAQFCPAHPEYLVVGTYELQADQAASDEPVPGDSNLSSTDASSSPQSRNGSLVVFKMTGDKLVKIQTLPQPSALLDVRFYRDVPAYQDVLAVVSSTGSLAIFKLDPLHDPDAPLKHLATSRCEDLGEDVLFLQCNWHPSVLRVIGVTTSTGLVRLLRLTDEWEIDSSTDLAIPNALEAWCVAFSPGSTAADSSGPSDNDQDAIVSVYCGGDDSMLRYTSCSWSRDSSGSWSLGEPYASCMLKGQHGAGVTAIMPLSLEAPDGGRVVVTGSYDDHLRVFSIHDLHKSYGMRRAKLLVDVDLGGGVWRLDLADVRTNVDSGASNKKQIEIRILASCMYAGARLVEIVTDTDGSSDWSCNVLARFEEHKSMNYASDVVVSARVNHVDRMRMVSTSFYDRLLCVWEYEAKAS